MIKHPILCQWLTKFPLKTPEYAPGPISTVLIISYYNSIPLAPFTLNIVNINHLFYQSIEKLNREAHFRFDKIYFFSFEFEEEPIPRNRPISDLNGITLTLRTREGNSIPVKNLHPRKIWSDGDGVLVLSTNQTQLVLVKVNPRTKVYREIGRFESKDCENFKLPNTPDPRFAIIDNAVFSFYGFQLQTQFPHRAEINFIDDFRVLVQIPITLEPLEWESFVYNLETRERSPPRELSNNNRPEIDFFHQDGRVYYEIF